MEERPSQNSEDGAPEDGLAGRNVAPVSGELEAEKARVRAGTRNLAVLSGCFVVVLAMAIFAPLVYFHFFATAVSSAASNAFQNTAKTVAAFINRAPERTVNVSCEFAGADAVNKYVIAEVRADVNRREEFTKFKILNGDISLKASATFQYFIPLRGLKYSVRKNADGAYDFVFYFDTLRLEEPVKYGLSALEINQSKFSDDVNQSLSEFIKSDFPKYLRSRGGSTEIVYMARMKAEDAVREYLQRNVFALFGVLGGKIGRVDIVFNTAAFDNFAPDLSVKIGAVQPVTGVKSDGK